MSGEAKAPRAWQRMLSGRRLDLLAPDPADIEIEDIAHGLARVARWNGQTKGERPFSVAQHSLLVERVVRELSPSAHKGDLLAALLHDAPEYVIGDLISPFKAAIGLDYKAFELRLLDAIHRRFGLAVESASLASTIKSADRIAAYYEATALAGFSIEEARSFFGEPQLSEHLHEAFSALAPMRTGEAESAFLARFGELFAPS